jgi:hypothetical protein
MMTRESVTRAIELTIAPVQVFNASSASCQQVYDPLIGRQRALLRACTVSMPRV